MDGLKRPNFLSIEEARSLMQKGELTAEVLVEACSQQIERLNEELCAFITVMPPAPGRVDGRLAGIPMAVKGLRTTAGARFFADYVPEADAVAVTKLREAGAVIMGKTNTHEIALGVTTVNPHYGTTRNPWDKERIPGGSSGGSAVAVATGMALGALGTDTGGSIRIPASLCGVVGLKPTYGRVSLRGVFPLSWNLDHAGPLTNTVKDAAILLQVIAGYDELDPASINTPVADYLSGLEGGVKGWRIAVLTGDYAWGSEPEISDAVRSAGMVFQSLGAQVEPVEMN